MRTYGLTMLPDNGSIVPVLMPFYTAEAHNSLERGSRPYSVVEILREVFSEDFFKEFPDDYMFEFDESRAPRSKFSTLEHVGVETLSAEAVEPGGDRLHERLVFNGLAF